MTTRQFEYEGRNYLLELIASPDFFIREDGRKDLYDFRGSLSVYKLRGKTESFYEKIKRIVGEEFIILGCLNKSLVGFSYGNLLTETWEKEPEIIAMLRINRKGFDNMDSGLFKREGFDNMYSGLLERACQEAVYFIHEKVNLRMKLKRELEARRK